jgi:glycosyltransferase involved in cell wall biosynthesis
MDLSYVERLPKAPGRRLRFGYVGSIIKTKGVHVLVDAFLRAVAGRVDLELHVFGAPNRWTKGYFDELKQKTAHCPFVTFHGRFDNKQISSVLQKFDVLVLTLASIWFENAPLTLNEAAISETPILAHPIVAACSMFRPLQQLRLDASSRRDAQDLADKMHRLADDLGSLVLTLRRQPALDHGASGGELDGAGRLRPASHGRNGWPRSPRRSLSPSGRHLDRPAR